MNLIPGAGANAATATAVGGGCYTFDNDGDGTNDCQIIDGRGGPADRHLCFRPYGSANRLEMFYPGLTN